MSEPIHADAVVRLEEEAEAQLAPGWDEDALVACLGPAQGLILRGLGRVSGRVLDAAPRLRIVARHGAGVDNVDLDAARARGVIVTNTPDATTAPVAEHTVALMLAVARRVSLGDRGLRAGDWGVRERCWGMDLSGRTLGVVGLGRIGRRVAAICHHGLGMAVAYYDVVAPPATLDLPAERLSLEEVLACADVLTLHVPLTAQTRHLIGGCELALLKPGAILINASRGPVVDEGALAEALEAGRLGGAGLDVFEREPVQGVHPLAAFGNVVLTPHIASSTPGTMRRMAMDAVEEVLTVLAGREPRYRVV
jgi:D-3-phosphoglycerate dehydrogenase